MYAKLPDLGSAVRDTGQLPFTDSLTLNLEQGKQLGATLSGDDVQGQAGMLREAASTVCVVQ